MGYDEELETLARYRRAHTWEKSFPCGEHTVKFTVCCLAGEDDVDVVVINAAGERVGYAGYCGNDYDFRTLAVEAATSVEDLDIRYEVLDGINKVDWENF